MRSTFFKKSILLIAALAFSTGLFAQYDFSTDYFKIHIDGRGWITSMKNITVKPNREFSSSGKPSPLMCLYESGKKVYYEPVRAEYNKGSKTLTLDYDNGSVAKILLVPHKKYFKLTLVALSGRKDIESVQWGSYHTNITNLMGEIIGVARDTSEAVNYAIGMLALNDNTLGGLSSTVGDAAPFQYIIHTPDATHFPLPDSLHEGQVFSLGGNGISDVAFYAHKEPWYRIMYGDAAQVDAKGRISISYQSRDRSRKREILFSLIPHMAANIPNHIEVQPLPGVDYIGSSVALWGSPDSTALMDVIQNIVLSEKLPYPTINGKWVKDPAAFVPDAITSGGLYDSIISYTKQLGLKAISLYDQGFVRADRGNGGYIDGRNFEKKPLKMTTGNISHKDFSALAAKEGIIIGRTPITNSLAPGTKDASPIPSDSLCYQQKRILTLSLSPADTIVIVDDPKHLEEIASWEGHCANLNMIKIGKELIHYMGVSDKPPYRLLHVKRGYWKTIPASHAAGDTVYKLQVTVNYGYDGIIPNMQLQDEIAKWFADVCKINGLAYYDFDGQEFLFNNGHGYYSAKRFFHKMFDRAKEEGVPYIRFTGATLSEGSWHYQSIWNVGGGKNLYDADKREWGSTTSQGKDLRDVTYSNFFPVGMGGNFPITAKSTVEQYEHIQAISVSVGTTYSLQLNQKEVESCPQKAAIFNVIRTWENARAANAFPRWVKKELANPAKNFHLEAVDDNSWNLYKMNRDGSGKELLSPLKRTGSRSHEYQVSVNGNDANDGSALKPFKTIMAAARVAMAGDVVTVHAGVYREQITPPRGGNSDKERITYQAAKGEQVDIKGSEIVKGWKQIANDTWLAKMPNAFFGSFNPYKEFIHGDWFWPTPKERKYLRGEVYLNGDWLMEAEKKEDVFKTADEKNQLWCASVDDDSTTIWAQFKNTDPNKETVEINVRQTVFYPDKPFINFITVRGFTMEQAATNWAPPTAEQMGLIGTHWSRGWIIENNKVLYSKCVGISLGKYGDAHDNNQTESAEGYVGTIKRALAFGWNKETVGGHIVRNNEVAYCEQTGIVGSMGCAFSLVQGNVIHDIHIRRLFNGAEMAGIKFHGAVDVQITGNHIYRTNMGIWLDWMAQGVQVKNNLLHDNGLDLFMEVDHGPMLVSNNVMLSKTNLYMNSSGAAFVHNLFSGKADIINYDSRLTPYMLPHSTFVKALHDNPSGDVQFINNLFVNGADVSQYSKALLPVRFDGNVYTKGTVRIKNSEPRKSYGEMTEAGKEKMKEYREQLAQERNAIADTSLDAAAKLNTIDNKVYLQITFNKKWLQQKRQLVTTGGLGKAIVPGLPFENTDGSQLKINTDYFGKQRNVANPSPGPFKIHQSGLEKIQVW